MHGLVILGDFLGSQRGGRQYALVLDLLDALGDQLFLDRLLVDLLQPGGRFLRRQFGDLLQLLVGVLEAGLDALEVEDGQAADLAHGAGEFRIDDAVHGRGQAGEFQLVRCRWTR